MDRLVRCLAVFIGVLVLFSGGFAGRASAQTSVVVNSVAALEAALAAAATANTSTDIRIATGTYNIATPLSLRALGGVTVTLENAGDGPVILQATQPQNILTTGGNDNGGLGPFPHLVVRGLTFSGAGTALEAGPGTLLVENSTFVDNKLGFYADFSRAIITLVNDTFSGNGCGGGSFSCGGIIFDSHQSSTATNITVVGNDQGVAGLDTLQNSIVVGNTVDCSHFLHSALQSVSNSINSDGTCRAATGQATTVDPQLAALADNGGLVKTMALPATSPAVNTGSNALCPATDARGAVRADGACDIGAFERSQAFAAESVTGAGAVTFGTPDGTFVDFHAVDPSSPPQAGRPPGVTFPFGLFEWTLVDLSVGATVGVSISFPSPVPLPPQYWKVDASGAWTNICPLLPCVVDPSFPNLLRLTITDGGVGDLDGIVNGMIRDPGGVGVSQRPADQTPPETVATLSPAPNAAGWNNTNVVVTLKAQDEAGGSGVKEIHYALSGARAGVGIVGGASTSLPLPVSPEGTTIVKYFAVDNAGNQETAKTITVRIDGTAPSIAITTPSAGATYELGQSVAAIYACADDLSGVVTCAGSVSSGANLDTATVGRKDFMVKAFDLADNSTSRSFSYQVACHYVLFALDPATVPQGGSTTVSARVKSCASTAQTVVVKFTLAGPVPSACGSTKSVMFTTAPFTLQPATVRSVSFPFRVPSGACPGTYSITATTLVNGTPVDTTSASLTVSPR